MEPEQASERGKIAEDTQLNCLRFDCHHLISNRGRGLGQGTRVPQVAAKDSPNRPKYFLSGALRPKMFLGFRVMCTLVLSG